MRKRSEQVYSRESSATLQLTVSLLYRPEVKHLQKCVIFDSIYVSDVRIQVDLKQVTV